MAYETEAWSNISFLIRSVPAEIHNIAVLRHQRSIVISMLVPRMTCELDTICGVCVVATIVRVLILPDTDDIHDNSIQSASCEGMLSTVCQSNWMEIEIGVKSKPGVVISSQ